MYVNLKNVRLFVQETGTGPRTLIFTHYFGGSSHAWRAVTDRLAGRFRCIAVDLRGHGDSDAPPTGYAVDYMADDLAGLIQELAVDAFVLVGHSMGGKVALALAAGSPTRPQPAGLQSLVLVSPSPPSPEPMSDTDRHQLLIRHGQPEAAEDLFRKITNLTVPEAAHQQIVTDNLRTAVVGWQAWLEQGSRENIADRLGAIGIPVHIVVGSEDRAIAPAVQQTATLPLLKNATLTVLENGGHLLPYELPAQLADFIQQKAASGDY